MKLIKISSDKVQIKTDSEYLKSLKINDLLSVTDDNATIVCVVTGITGRDAMNIYDYDSELIGQTEADNTIDCGIIGSINNGVFTKSIDIYPTADSDINIITNEMFANMLECKKESTFRLGTYAGYGIEAIIDGNKLFQRHSAVIGSTGSGKSFAVTSLLEKVSALKGSNVILLDLHGEYSELSFAKTIKIGVGGLDFPVWFLPFKDMYSSLLRLKEESATIQLSALRKAYYCARTSRKSESVPIAYDIRDILEILKTENDEQVATGEVYKTGAKAGYAKTVKGENNGKLSSVISLIEDKLTDSRYAFMFGDKGQSYLNYFINEIFGIDDKNIKVLDLSSTPHDMAPTVAAVLTKLIYSVQLQQNRQNIVPVTIVCEEAHMYIPSSDFGLSASQRRLLDIFETIAKEGRKFGASLCIVSQRPSELNKTIMAQCANFIVLKMTNETDKLMMKDILPESSKNIVGAVTLFSPGDGLIIGDCTEITIKTKIDLPSEAPKSNTIDVWDIWRGCTELDIDALVGGLMNEERGD